MTSRAGVSLFFFFNDTATTEIYTLSLHDALPICVSSVRSWCSRRACRRREPSSRARSASAIAPDRPATPRPIPRSEEHTSELQSRLHLVCRLLLEKKKKSNNMHPSDDDPESR